MGTLKSIRWLAASIALLVAVAASAARAHAQCRGPDSTATRMVAIYTNILDRAAVDSATRQQLTKMNLPQPPATVTLVSDKTVCRKAEQVYTAALRGNGNKPSGAVYVLKIGTSYVVRDPSQRGGQWCVETVLDSQYRIKYKFGA